jgi:hypothetical protein
MSFAQRRSVPVRANLSSLPILGGYLTSTLADVTSAATAALAITGATSQTLADVTSSATGALAIVGDLAKTLQDVTLSADGGGGLSGALTATLADVSASSAGTLAIAGALSQTIADVSLASIGTVAIAGTLSGTLANATLSADGSSGILGQLAATLADVSISSDGVLTGSGFPVVTAQTPAGSSQHRRKRYFVEIDDQTFQVSSPEHARALLDRAREVAQSYAEELAQKAIVAPRKYNAKPIKLATPTISSPNPELREIIQSARKSINAVYRNAAIDAELSLLLRRKIAEEEEEEAILLLI